MPKKSLCDNTVYKEGSFTDFSNIVAKHFKNICSELRKFDCTYFSYALELKDSKRVHYYSSQEWQDAFVKEKLIQDCPLILFCHQNNYNGILSWNDLASSLNRSQRRVMDARKYYSIGNGIGFQQYIYGMREIVTFASDPLYHDYPIELYTNIDLYKQYICQFRTIAIADMVTKGWLKLSQAENKAHIANFFINNKTKH